MSFLVYPCDVTAWFEGTDLADATTLLGIYRAMIGRVPELNRFEGELSKLTGMDADVMRRINAGLTPPQIIDVFYNLLTGAKPSTAALSQLVNDPLNTWFSAPAKRAVIPVGASGNGIRRFEPNVAATAVARLDFPFAPALWNSVVSAGATAGKQGERASYSNGAEVLMDGDASITATAPPSSSTGPPSRRPG